MNEKQFTKWLEDFVNDLDELNLEQTAEVENHFKTFRRRF